MLDDVLTALNAPALTAWDVPVSWAELLGDAAGAGCVWLVARQNVWNWPLGLLNNVLWALLFWNSMLYADATLQGAFFGLGVYGWWKWLDDAGSTRPRVLVRRTTLREWQAIIALTVLGTGLVAWYLATQTRSPAPVSDASVLTMSLAATYGQAQKLIESWWIWIVVDLVSVPLYLSRGLYPTALLYAIFCAMCFQGLREWRTALSDLEGQLP